MFCRTPPLLPPFCNGEIVKSNAEFQVVPRALGDITSLELSVTNFDFSVTDPSFCVTIRVSNRYRIEGPGRRTGVDASRH
jgi:hypothetical protein